jgi:CRP/FNR family cyclic AMP-dependent transcriptional regulator
LASEFLRALSEDDRQSVIAACSRRRFRKDETIFHQGDGGEALFIIERGKVAMRMLTADGDEVSAMIIGRSETFGEFGVLSSDPRRTTTVVAIEATDVMVLTRDAFNELRRRSPAIEQALFDSLNDRVARLANQMRAILYLSLESRVFTMVANLAPIYDKGTEPVTITLTQAQLATMVGTTRPTINKILRAAEKDGLIKLGRGRVVIVDLDGIQQASR